MRNSNQFNVTARQQRKMTRRQSLLSFVLLVVSLFIAGTSDAAVRTAATLQSQQHDHQPVLEQMLRHALFMYATGDYRSARLELLPLAQQDVIEAQFYLGSLYDSGLGGGLNSAMAAHWYERAARNGHVEAQYNMGAAFANGEGVQHNPVNAVRWWRKAADNGSVNAQFNLGIMYLHGNMGVSADPVEAAIWWGKAAEQGDPVAQYNLGALYANGEGVSQDIDVAMAWWSRAARQGFQQAISSMQSFQNYRATSPH